MRSFGDFEPLDSMILQHLLTYLRERYGFPEEFWGNYLWLRRVDTQALWVIGRNAVPVNLCGLETAGLLAFREAPPLGYPTNAFMRAFGTMATRNIFVIKTEASLLAFLRGESLEEGEAPRESGYCPVVYRGLAVGRGEWKNGVLHCKLSKALRLQPQQGAA